MDISDYLNFTFELVGVQNEDKIKIYDNAAKYANCLKQYFKSMGIKVDLGFKSAYKLKQNEALAPIKSKVTLEEIRDTYMTLMSKRLISRRSYSSFCVIFESLPISHFWALL